MMIQLCLGLVLWTIVLWACVLLFVLIRDILGALRDGCRAAARLVGRLCRRLLVGVWRLVSPSYAR